MNRNDIAAVIAAAARRATSAYGQNIADTVNTPLVRRAWWSFFLEQLDEIACGDVLGGAAARDSDGARAPCAAPAPAPGGNPAAGRRINLAWPHPSWRARRPEPGAERDVSIGAGVAHVNALALAEALGMPNDVSIEFIDWDFARRVWRFSLRGTGLPTMNRACEPERVDIVIEGAASMRQAVVHGPGCAPPSDA